MERLTRTSDSGEAAFTFNLYINCLPSEAKKILNLATKLKEYEDLEERLNKVYGDCDGLLLRVVEMLEKHPCIDIANNTLKSRLLTDEDVDKWEKYKQLEEQGRLVKLPCDKVYYIVDKNNPKYAAVMSKTIRDLTVYEIENIDIDGRYFLTKELAEAKLKELRGGEDD